MVTKEAKNILVPTLVIKSKVCPPIPRIKMKFVNPIYTTLINYKKSFKIKKKTKDAHLFVQSIFKISQIHLHFVQKITQNLSL